MPSKPQLEDLVEVLHKVAYMWEMIGLQLGIPMRELAIIAKYQHHPNICLVRMLETWLEQVDPPATWTDIINVVECLGEEQLGRELREKYCGEHVDNTGVSKISILRSISILP